MCEQKNLDNEINLSYHKMYPPSWLVKAVVLNQRGRMRPVMSPNVAHHAECYRLMCWT